MPHVMLRKRLTALQSAAASWRANNATWSCRPISTEVEAESQDSNFEAFGTSAISFREPIVLSEDGLRTLRTRKYGNTPLPIPEIMDPIYLKARDKHKRSKASDPARHEGATETNLLTPFQQELASNPHAHMLASPVRQCLVTRARLPLDFLIKFGLLHAASPQNSQPGEAKPGELKPFWSMLSDRPGRELIGQPSYVLAKKSVVRLLGPKKAKGVGKWVHLPTQKTKEVYAKLSNVTADDSVKPASQWHWDADMPEKVLHNLQSHVIHLLKRRWNEGVVRRLEDIDQENVLAFVRLVRNPANNHLHDQSATKADECAEITKYDLTELCDNPLHKQFVEHTGIEDDVIAIVKHPKGASVIVAIQRLRSYDAS